MNHLAELPVWAAVAIGALVLLGAFMALTGALGLLRLRSFYQRMHAPTLGATMGMASIVLASVICFSVLRDTLVIHALLVGIFITISTVAAFVLLARAALYRDRQEDSEEVPPP